MKDRFVITIGRQYGSGGRDIGHMLAKKMDISFYDKELLLRASQESGLCPEFFEKADERSNTILSHAFAAGFTFGGPQYNDVLSNERLFQIQSDVIRNIAEEESCVIVGRCADYILRDIPYCRSVFINAPLEDRVKRVMDREKLQHSDAMNLVRKVDKNRSSYYGYYTDKVWGAADSYHLCIDSSILGCEKSVLFIKQFIEEI